MYQAGKYQALYGRHIVPVLANRKNFRWWIMIESKFFIMAAETALMLRSRLTSYLKRSEGTQKNGRRNFASASWKTWKGEIMRSAWSSFWNYLSICYLSKLHLSRDRIGRLYNVHSDSYAIFRESRCSGSEDRPVVLVIGFRLKFIRSIPLLHWLFQRICILTTPFWSGMEGFRVKLWMVSPDTKNYLGIYDWQTGRRAQDYLDYLLPILRFFSVKGTVWAEKYEGVNLESYLNEISKPDRVTMSSILQQLHSSGSIFDL